MDADAPPLALSKAQALKDAKAMLGRHAVVWRISSPHRELRFNVGVHLKKDDVLRVGMGASWAEALACAEVNVLDTVRHEQAQAQESRPAE